TNSATWARFACCDAKDRYCSVSSRTVNSFLRIDRKTRAAEQASLLRSCGVQRLPHTANG
ncbi:hypothetical protein, partial [Burkholderia sp. HMSC10F09]|uniref:hypothetical protein n=1 Tax=Burkholderia sp. HMSC10F09 TaxID=1581083 RepID=UPI00114CA9EA